jgi:hypothetical protein
MMLALLARELLYFYLCLSLFSLEFSFLPYFYIDRSEDGTKVEEPAVHGTTPTSTSNTMVLSEENHCHRNFACPRT